MLLTFSILPLTTLVATGPSDLARTIAASQAGDVIHLEAGIYEGPIRIERPVVLVGKGPETIITTTRRGGIVEVDVDGEVRFERLELRGPGLKNRLEGQFADEGGVMSVRRGNVTLKKVTVRGGLAYGTGGAIYVSAGSLRLEDCIIAENFGNPAGGIGASLRASSLEIIRTRIVGNLGSGVAAGAKHILLLDVEFGDNRASGGRPADHGDLIVFGAGNFSAMRVKFDSGGYVESSDPPREVRVEDTVWVGPQPADH